MLVETKLTHNNEYLFHKPGKHKQVKELHEAKLRRLNSICILASIGRHERRKLMHYMSMPGHHI